ncbi:hypothetical protein BGZ73_001474 [Actinomortierella ambigua]|nr:hypothetical protein BGZ73_001474 [Actinomortierella ambigua]
MPSGLEFVYTESSRQFRAISTSFWMLGAALGTVWINTFDPPMVRGAIFFSIMLWLHVPRKNRKSINQVAQEAKDTEFSQTCY